MSFNSRRGKKRSAKLPFRPAKPKILGVRKFKEWTHQGWKIVLFRREQGIQTRRIAFSARVTNQQTQESFYIPPADNQKHVIQAAQHQIQKRIEEAAYKDDKFETVQRVLDLWFQNRDEDDLPPLPTAMPTES